MGPPQRGEARGPLIIERNIVLQTLVSVVISMLMTALIMYGFLGADMEATISMRGIWRMGMAISILAPALIAPLMGYRIEVLLSRLQRTRDQLEDLAKRDALTGLLNRRGFETAAQDIWSGGAVCALMCDIDRFKSINDSYGHDIGDLALIHVARVIRETVGGPARVLGRLGGEEFAVLLQVDDVESGSLAAERLRAACEAAPLKLDSLVVPITLSIGVAALGPDKASLRRLLTCADKALYRAKQEGRNRVRVASASEGAENENPEGVLKGAALASGGLAA